jgi:hypothetical protein
MKEEECQQCRKLIERHESELQRARIDIHAIEKQLDG